MNERGFTLVEVLVVVLIVGILAAIALPTFLGQRDKAQDSSAKSNARNAVSHIETCLLDTSYTACSGSSSVISLATPVAGGSANSYTLSAYSPSGNAFSITKTPNLFSRACTSPGAGGCPVGGSW